MPEGFSTDSYPKAALPVSPLDTVEKLGRIQMIPGQLQQQQQSLQSNALTIDKQKLDLVNQRFGEFSKGLTALINKPDLTPDDIQKFTTTNVKLGYIPAEMGATFQTSMPAPQSFNGDTAKWSTAAKQEMATQLQHAQTVKEAIDYHAGTNGLADTGGAVAPYSVSQKPPALGGGFRQTGPAVAKTLPVGQTGTDPQTNNPTFAGPPPGSVSGFPAAPGSAAPQPMPVSPAAPLNSTSPIQPKPVQTSRITPAPPQLFEAGRKAYEEDQALATQKLTAIKPALLALDKIPDLRSGPGTKTFNEAIAALKAIGVIPTATKDDPTAVYQEVNKYLHQYLKGRGGRSDADLQAAEDSSPNPGTQINPALLKLTQTAVAQDRIEAARANAFSGSRTNYRNSENRPDLQNYLDQRNCPGRRWPGPRPGVWDEKPFFVFGFSFLVNWRQAS